MCPGYREYYDHQALVKCARELMESLESCSLCPHSCRVNRLKGQIGWCGAGYEVEISGFGAHFGEEAPLAGNGGSGTIFFNHCTLRCIFCQNWDISHGHGESVSLDDLASIMLDLQKKGCHNINLVSPTHYLPQIVSSLSIAENQELFLPLVYNCGGYEKVETLKKLRGIIDIYLPDFKYSNPDIGFPLSGVKDYPERARESLKEMQDQVGNLILDEHGIAQHGLLIRHLILPGGLSGTHDILSFIAQEISPTAYINLMDQYHPCFHADEISLLRRRITSNEYQQAIREARDISPRFRLDKFE
jgi:putative pyruvate formate lyase activating enzyme